MNLKKKCHTQLIVIIIQSDTQSKIWLELNIISHSEKKKRDRVVCMCVCVTACRLDDAIKSKSEASS